MSDIKDFGCILVPFYNFGEKYPYRKGSAFLLQYNGELYIFTAKHCVESDSIPEFLNPTSQKLIYNYPILNTIKFTDNIEMDIALFKVNDKEFCDNIISHIKGIRKPIDEALELINSLYFCNILKIDPKTIYEYRNQKNYNDIQEAITNTNTSLLDSKYLRFADDTFKFSSDKEYHVLGYPGDTVNFEYLNDEHKNKIILNKYELEFYKQENGNVKFKYKKDFDYNGISGGPIICEDEVVGMITDQCTSEKTLGGYSFHVLKKGIILYKQNSNEADFNFLQYIKENINKVF